MIESNIAVNNSNLRVEKNVKLLQEGQNVLVRVVSEKGNNKYQGFVGGVGITFSSKNPLKPGTTFIANVKFNNGKIELIPNSDGKDFVSSKNVLNNSDVNLTALLQTLGLKSDELSRHILLQFKQLQLPLDSKILKKIYTLAQKTKGKEKQVAELLSILTEKKLNLSEAEFFEILGIWEKGLDSNSEAQKKVLNQFNSKIGKWYVFPFKIIELAEENMIGEGSIKLFFNQAESIQLINLFCSYQNSNFYFLLEYEQKLLKKIKFNVSAAEEKNSNGAVFDRINLTKRLSEKVKTNSCIVEWAEVEEILSTQCNKEEFQYLEAHV